jgi:hypothetical protein
MKDRLEPSEVADVRRMLGKRYSIDTIAHTILIHREVGQHNKIIAEVTEIKRNINIPGKWEWIKGECLKRGFTGAAFKAGKIEDALFETYGKTVTPAWADTYRRSTIADTDASIECIDRVINSRPFCYGCFKAPFGGCSESCEFGKKYGFCSTRKSIFDSFKVAWAREKVLQEYKGKYAYIEETSLEEEE